MSLWTFLFGKPNRHKIGYDDRREEIAVKSDQSMFTKPVVKNKRPTKGVSSCADSLIVGTYSIEIDGEDVGATVGGVTMEKKDGRYHIYFNCRSLSQDFMSKFFKKKQISKSSEDFCMQIGKSSYTTYDIIVNGPGPGCGCRTWVLKNAKMESDFFWHISTTEPCEMPMEFSSLELYMCDHDHEFSGAV